MEDIAKRFEDTLKEIDVKSIVSDIIREHVENVAYGDIDRMIKSVTESEVRKIVVSEIEKQFKKPVSTDDGWGKTASYDSFEQLFKQVFNDKLNSSWEFKREIERQTKSRVDEFIAKRARNLQLSSPRRSWTSLLLMK